MVSWTFSLACKNQQLPRFPFTSDTQLMQAHFATLFLFALSLPSGAALAADGDPQSATDAAPKVLPKVVIKGKAEDPTTYVAAEAGSATKTDTPLIETPLSVSVIGQAQIEAQQAQSMNQALRYTPGVQTEQFGVDNVFDFFQIRGFSANQNGIFRDGLQLNTPNGFGAFRLEPYGAERIEVVRGPGSVLFGQSNPGGIVNYVSKLPARERFQELEFEAGSFNLWQGKFDLTGPVAQTGPFSSLDYRLIGLVRDSGTQVDYKPNDRRFLAPALTWHLGENTSITLLGQYQDDHVAHLAFLPKEGTALYNPNGRIPINRFDGEPTFDHFYRMQYSAGYIIDHQFSDEWSVSQHLRLDHVNTDFQSVFGTGIEPADPTQRLLDRSSFASRSSTDAFSVDTHLQGKFATGPLNHTLLLGFDYQHNDFDEREGLGTAASLDIYAPVYGGSVGTPVTYLDSDSLQQQAGLYLQEQVKLYDHLVAVVGGREDFVWSDTPDRLAATTSAQHNNQFSGRAGLAYLFDIGLTPYFNYSESFLPVLGTDTSGQPFKPETGRQFEGGLKFQPPGWNALLTLAGFNTVRQNVLTPDLDPSHPFNQVQTGEIRSRGIEVGGTASPFRGLNLIAAYTLQDVEVTASNAGDVGKRPVATPKYLASFWADYTLPSGRLNGFGCGGGIRYQGASYGDAANTLKSGDFTVFDAALHYQWHGLRFAINVQNLFDNHYIAAISGANAFYGAGRTVIGSVRYKF